MCSVVQCLAVGLHGVGPAFLTQIQGCTGLYSPRIVMQYTVHKNMRRLKDEDENRRQEEAWKKSYDVVSYHTGQYCTVLTRKGIYCTVLYIVMLFLLEMCCMTVMECDKLASHCGCEVYRTVWHDDSSKTILIEYGSYSHDSMSPHDGIMTKGSLVMTQLIT